jgi:hypothetical protein
MWWTLKTKYDQLVITLQIRSNIIVFHFSLSRFFDEAIQALIFHKKWGYSVKQVDFDGYPNAVKMLQEKALRFHKKWIMDFLFYKVSEEK